MEQSTSIKQCQAGPRTYCTSQLCLSAKQLCLSMHSQRQVQRHVQSRSLCRDRPGSFAPSVSLRLSLDALAAAAALCATSSQRFEEDPRPCARLHDALKEVATFTCNWKTVK